MLKPLKATSKPPQRHILGIDSGIQSHPKAPPKPPQGYPKATPRLHQGSTKATPRLHQGHPSPGQSRNPKSEIRRKSENRSPKEASPDGLAACWRDSGFGFRISGFLRSSDFGLRVSVLAAAFSPQPTVLQSSPLSRPKAIPKPKGRRVPEADGAVGLPFLRSAPMIPP